MIDVEPTFTWLLHGAPGAKTPLDVLDRACPELRQAGIPLDRLEAVVRTLHPHIAGRSFLWVPSGKVVVKERTYVELNSAEFEKSAVAEVFRDGQTVRYHLEIGETGEHPELVSLAEEGFTDFIAIPMTFISGTIHAVTFATRRPSGFSLEEREALKRVMLPLARVAEIFALLRTATNLLNTYVGHGAGERILGGQIRRGDVGLIHAVIWFSDLRGFTSMSSASAPTDIIATLNEVFDCQVPPIEANHGEVLKFMGDGMLAIFPVHDENDRRERVDDALVAAKHALYALDKLNAKRTSRGQEPVRFGIALHIGEIAYGNIGGSGRLDFTCIGPAVNLAARLETLTGKLGRNVIVSEEFAELASSPLEQLGEFELKGVETPARVFGIL